MQLLLALFTIPILAAAQVGTFTTATVDSVVTIDRTDTAASQLIQVTLENGGRAEVENTLFAGRSDREFTTGDTVILESVPNGEGGTMYIIREVYRVPALLMLAAVFFVAVFLLGGRTGIGSFFGLLLSIAILLGFVVPQILLGSPPLLISLIGSFAIAGSAIFLAHGFHKRTMVAVAATMITLVIAALIAVLFVASAHLFGLGTEEGMFIQTGGTAVTNLQGLLLGGIIIGALGVLDDITTAQVAAIDELSFANPKYGYQELRRAGLSIGREHVASLVNTLALAYIGASLPMFILFQMNDSVPLWVTMNTEFIAEEVVRTLVGSMALLFAVPISTHLAAYLFRYGQHTKVCSGHIHQH